MAFFAASVDKVPVGDLETERTALVVLVAAAAAPVEPSRGRRSAEMLACRGVPPFARGGRSGFGETVTGVCGSRVVTVVGDDVAAALVVGDAVLCTCCGSCGGGGCCCVEDSGQGVEAPTPSRVPGSRIAAAPPPFTPPVSIPVGEPAGEVLKDAEELAANTRGATDAVITGDCGGSTVPTTGCPSLALERL